MIKTAIKKFTLSFAITSLLMAGSIHAAEMTDSAHATLSFSDGKPSITDLKQINTVLHTVGVNLSQINIPHEAQPILKLSSEMALNPAQQTKILTLFSLDRQALLNQVYLANRKPVVADSGDISTEEGVAVYPKIFDMRSLNPETRIAGLLKSGRLHMNFTDSGQGVDEVMTLVSGGPWAWFFVLKDNVVAKVAFSRVSIDGPGWRISYPGLTPHGAFMGGKDGLCVAYIYGPKIFHMHYDAPHIKGTNLLGTNPWIDFTHKEPVMRSALP